jgi:hypothetical protein
MVKDGETPQVDAKAVMDGMRRRGAFFSHQYGLYRNGRHVEGYRMCIPKELPWAPFHLTLKESGLAAWVDDKLIERNVIPIHGD